MVKRIDMFEAEDGRKFDTKSEALMHEFNIEIDRFIKNYCVQNSIDIYEVDIARFIYSYRKEILELLNLKEKEMEQE